MRAADGRAMRRLSMKKAAQTVAALGLATYAALLLLSSLATEDHVIVADDRGVASMLAGDDDGVEYAERHPRALMTSGRRRHQGHDAAVALNGLAPNGSASAEAAAITSSPTALDEVFISVKTTKNFHRTRLDVILKTWFVLAREQTYFFTDADDEDYQQKTKGHLINTNCSSSHNRKALCCKMSVEFDTFLESNKRWFCHFDDDNYVNIPQLVKMLQKYNPTEDWYLGKTSIRSPLEILNRDNFRTTISFWFATGGAGFCISRALALKMVPLASSGKFISIGEKIRLPDDVTMGYIIEYLLKNKLTVINEFHSHLEPMKFIKQETFPDQISFSYSRYGKESNIVTLDGFDLKTDPTRFLSLHCFLFPNFSFCPR